MHPFDQDISFTAQGAKHFTAQISDKWLINGIPHGGYLMAIMANVALSLSEKSFISIFTANFITRCQPGPAAIYVERIGQSKTFERFQIRLLQGDKEKIRALATLMDMDDEHNGMHYHEQDSPEILPRDHCIQIPEIPNMTFYNQMDIHLEPQCTDWFENRLSDRSEMKGWARFKEPRSLDQLALTMIVDAFPPPVLATQGKVAWAPTVEFSLNLRNLPDSAWLKCIFRSRFIDNGMVDEDGEVWDEGDRLIAISRQISQFRAP